MSRESCHFEKNVTLSFKGKWFSVSISSMMRREVFRKSFAFSVEAVEQGNDSQTQLKKG